MGIEVEAAANKVKASEVERAAGLGKAVEVGEADSSKLNPFSTLTRIAGLMKDASAFGDIWVVIKTRIGF